MKRQGVAENNELFSFGTIDQFIMTNPSLRVQYRDLQLGQRQVLYPLFGKIDGYMSQADDDKL
jgi:hypothetical protein